MSRPGDVQRVLAWEELPASVRELEACGKAALAGGLLLSSQAEWVRLCKEHDLTIAEKGRRTGITYATALHHTIVAASQRQAGGDNVFYIGDTHAKGREFIGYCAHLARIMAEREHGLQLASNWDGIEVVLFKDIQDDGSTKDITAYRIRFASGFEIVALSSNPASIRGLQGIVIIDEAAFHRNVQAVIDAATALIIWGGKIRIISTHNGNKNAFNQLVLDARAGKNAFKVFRSTFDDAVAAGLYERVALVKGWTATPEGKEAWYKKARGSYTNRAAEREELDAIPRESSGTAIASVLIERSMRAGRPILRLRLEPEFALRPELERIAWGLAWIDTNLRPLLDRLPRDLEHYFGEDYARHRDFTVIAPITLQRNLRRQAPFLIELHNVPTRQQEQILWAMIEGLPNFRGGWMDATGNGATLAEYTADRYGRALIKEVMLNNAWYRQHMGLFVSAFEDDVLDVPRDLDVRNDLAAVELIDGVVKMPTVRVQDMKDPSLFRHGDSAMALALGYLASLHPAPKVEIVTPDDVRGGSALGALRGQRDADLGMLPENTDWSAHGDEIDW
ncbi:MAG: hypothetical protein AB7E47_12880 [Desulfovibrionaceae bacterium]